MDFIEVSAKTVDEAINKAIEMLLTPSDRLEITVVSEGSSGFFGIGSKPAVIRAAKKVVEEPVEEVLVKAEPKKAEKKEPAEKPVKAAKAEKPAKTERIEKAEKPERTEKPEKVEKAEKEQPKKEKKDAPKPEKREKTKKEGNRDNKKENNRNRKNKKEEAAAPAAPVKEAVVKREPKEEKPPVERTPEEIAVMKKAAEEFLKGVFAAMELPVVLKIEFDQSQGSLDIDFEGDDMGILIGKRGQTLDSLQYLTSLVVNKEVKDYVRVKLDTEDYRKRRKETLENLARNIAYKVKKTRKAVSLEPMNPYERRIIHSALQGNKFVETFSEGNEPYRHVVVSPKR